MSREKIWKIPINNPHGCQTELLVGTDDRFERLWRDHLQFVDPVQKVDREIAKEIAKAVYQITRKT